MEEIYFERIKLKQKKEELDRLGVDILCAIGKPEKAIEFYKDIISNYCDMEGSGNKSTKEMVDILKNMEKYFNKPLKFNVPDRERGRADLMAQDMMNMGRKKGKG